jgi:hypothetical protein
VAVADSESFSSNKFGSHMAKKNSVHGYENHIIASGKIVPNHYRIQFLAKMLNKAIYHFSNSNNWHVLLHFGGCQLFKNHTSGQAMPCLLQQQWAMPPVLPHEVGKFSCFKEKGNFHCKEERRTTMDDVRTIVFDTGSASMRGGFAGDDAPFREWDSIKGSPKKTATLQMVGIGARGTFPLKPIL